MEKTKLPNSYFPHDFNARFDRKILRCRKVLGIEGYGIFWMLIETLCLQENFSYPLKDVDLLADDFGCSVEKVEAVIKQFELFNIDKDAKFFSLSLIARLQKYLDISEKARLNANKRWVKSKEIKGIDATALLPHSESNAIKENNIKENEIILNKNTPELKEFLSYAKTLSIYHHSMNFQIEAKYNAWIENKWKDGNNKPIKNWKTKIQNTMPYFKKDFTSKFAPQDDRLHDKNKRINNDAYLKSIIENKKKIAEQGLYDPNVFSLVKDIVDAKKIRDEKSKSDLPESDKNSVEYKRKLSLINLEILNEEK